MNKKHIWNKELLLLVFINTVVFLGFNMSTAGFPAYVAFTGNSHISTGMVTTLSALASLLIRPFAGTALDNRNDKFFTLLGLLLLTSPVICIFTSNISVILVVRFLQGAGWGITSTSCSKLIANNLPRERLSEGIGYAGVFSSVATAFAPGLAITLFELNGSELMFGVIGACSISSIIIFLLIRQNTKVEKRSITKGKIQFVSPKAVIPGVLIMIITMTYAPMVTFITPYSNEIGISGTKYFFLAYAFSTIIARPLTGLYVDRKNTRLPTIIALTTSMLASIFMAYCNTIYIFAISGILAGIGTGSGMNALQTSSISKTAITMRGVAIATFLFGFDLGMAIGSLSAGMLLSFIEYKKMFIIMSVPSGIALLIVIILTMCKKNMADSEVESA